MFLRILIKKMNAKIEFVLGIVFYVHNISLIYQVQERRGHLLTCMSKVKGFISDLLNRRSV